MDTSTDRRGNLYSVRIIQRKNDLVLVQWEDKHNILRRNWVEQSSLVGESGHSAQVADPARGHPYGVEFWRLIREMRATPKDFDRELKQRGIWTVEDVRLRPQEVVGALIATYGVDLATLQLALDQYERDLTTEA